MAKKVEQKPAQVTSINVLDAYLKDNKDFHYQFEKPINYKVSMGSVTLDIETDGGLTPGLHRFCGPNEGGKSSQMLEVMANHLATVKPSKALLVKAEGRLSEEMQERSPVKFVYSAVEWVEGTCFVFECNVFETVFGLIRQLIKNNEEGIKYFFAIDSIDGLETKGDRAKELGEDVKVAGGALLSAIFMKKVALAMNKLGHICILISQVRSEINLDPYAKKSNRQTSATGGNALLHYANFIFEFEQRFGGDLIKEKEKEKPSPTNRILGHNAKITIKKSPNESTGLSLEYPIKYGRKKQSSIWIEHEVFQLLRDWNFLEIKGSWLSWDPELQKELKDAGIEVEEKIQGEIQFKEYLEQNPKLVKYLYDKFKTTLVEVKRNRNKK